MNIAYLIPFIYFSSTRIVDRRSLMICVVFEWCAQVMLVLAFGSGGYAERFVEAFACYVAFISLYEIGYLINDLVASKKEQSPNARGPQGVMTLWLAAWIATRLAAFVCITIVLGRLSDPNWWLFFGGMAIVYFMHNELGNPQLRFVTFVWLAWFRFLAPVFFVIDPGQRSSAALGAMSLHVIFRALSYLSSKKMLLMPARTTSEFRALYFLMPIAGAMATAGHPEMRAFRWMVAYYAITMSPEILRGVRTRVRRRSASP